MAKKIVVLGAGYSGVLTAKKLAKRLKGKDTEITIIDRNPFHTMLTELHEVAAWRVEEDSIKISLKRIFAGRDVKVVMDSVLNVDYDGKKLTGEHGEYEYDYLVMATGSKPTFFGVPGAKENCYTLWSYDDAVKLRDRIMNLFRQAAQEPDDDKKRQLLSFFIVGAGFTGVEMTGELAELVPILCKRFEIDPSLVTIYEGDILEKVVPILPDKIAAKVQRRLEKMNVKVLLGKGTTAIGDGWLEYKGKDDKEPVRLNVGTVIWTAGIEGSEISNAATNLEQKGRGRIQCDDFLRANGKEDIYIAGDNMFYIPEGEKDPVPQMVENCEHCADTIAHNLTVAITGQGTMEKYKPAFHGVMVCIGGKYGAAHVGLPGKFFGLPSFLAMMSKHFINVIYFIQVLGWNKVYSYLKHEFFTIRDTRSFVGGHLSNRTPSFMLMPLRVFLGAYWVYEGVLKILEHWFKAPMLNGFFSGANSYYEGILKPLPAFNANTTPIAPKAAAVVDTVSGASAEWVGGAAGPVVSVLSDPVWMDWKILGFMRFILVNSGEIAVKLQISFVDWIINTLVIPYDNVQIAFQVVIVMAEILVGLALIAGLFTLPAAGASLVLQILFLTSTGLYLSSWWMAFASLAVLFCGGRTLGLDYWVIPWLKARWKKIGFVKKWYIYND